MADDLKEIVTVEQIDTLFLALAIAGPIVGAALGAFSARKTGNAQKAIKSGFFLGCLGIANLGLWKIYNIITGRLGLDTVKNLLVNLGLFAFIGIVAGLVWRYQTKRSYQSQLSKPDTTE